MHIPRFSSFVWKFVIGLMCFLFAFAPILDLWTIRVAQAAGEGSGGVKDTPTIVPCGVGVWCTDIQQAQEINKVKSRIDYQLLFPLYLGALNAATMAAQQLAFDTAEWVANGGRGSLPLIEVLKFGDYTKQIAYDAAGEFIGTVSQKFTEGAFGINLCRPPRFQGLALEFALRLPTYALTGLNRPKPKCAWTDIVSNWEATKDSLTEQDVIKNISGTFTTGGNDVSFGIGLNVGFLDLMAERREAAVLDRLEGRGFKSVQSLISGNIQTPASIVEQSVAEQIVRQPNASQNIQTSALLNNAFELGWMQLGTVTLSTFSNVLISRLLGKVAKGLFDTSGIKGLTVPDFANSDAAPLSASGGKAEQIAADQYRDILTPKIATAEAQDLLGELLGCPDSGRTKWNCAMDQSMEAALRQGGMTVKQAIDQGFINAQFRLIPSTQLKDNLDPGCATRAFCVSNLRKLRLARIVPVGWEFAADSQENQRRCASGSGCVTLDEVIKHYDDCNANGELDTDHPWCHLIDQNWVFTSFQAQCLTKGYGNTFISGTNQRMQECQDTVTCLEKDANGKCSKGYGYCLAEQTYYQFDSLSCKEQYVSCRTYTPRGGNAKPIGYLRSTLDYGTCDASNVGCMWYSTKRNPDFREGKTNVPEWSTATQDRLYVNKNIERCTAADDGCTDLRRVVKDQPSLNMIRNSSFETINDQTKEMSYWVFDPASYIQDEQNPVRYTQPQVATGLASFDGSQSYLVAGPAQQVVALQPGRQYTLSFYARTFTNAPSDAGASVMFYQVVTGTDMRIPPSGIASEQIITNSTFFKSSGCAVTQLPAGATSHEASILLPSDLGTDWRRVQCSFVAPPKTIWARVRFIPGSTPWLADAVKLEESQVATAYNDGVNPNLTPVYLKTPPPELECSGDQATDNPLCVKYARVCRAYEAGCQGYIPRNQLEAPEIPAVLSSSDLCPAECVGYAQFQKQASTFDLVRNPDVPQLDDPDDQSAAAFIPSTANSCSAQDVGCEAFTVVDEKANGAEHSQGYSYLRLCQKPNDDTQTYYTWEGSEASGYQLVTWSMQRDTTAPTPQGPRVIVRTGKDGRLKDPSTCNPLSYLTGTDPDCRQFYDPQGNPFYRFESQTVLADVACTQMRKQGATKADCEKTGGIFAADTNLCVYQAMPEQSNSCDLSVAGCRAYLGTQGAAQTTVLEELFTGSDYRVNPGAGISGLSLSEESVLVGDHSLRVGLNSGSTAEVTVDVPTEPGMLYELSFWAKGTQSSPYQVTVQSSNPNTNSALTTIGTALVRQQWNVYRIGPFTGSSESGATSTRIHLSFPNSAGTAAFLDTIRVTQVTDVAYVVKDSWKTPDVCDQTSTGVSQPQAMLGCQDYVDRKQTVSHVRQFTNLCRSSSIGCTAYINTQNSQDPYEQRWSKFAKQEPVASDLPGKCNTDTPVFKAGGIIHGDTTPEDVANFQAAMSGKACRQDSDCVSGASIQGYGWCDRSLTVNPADQFSYYIEEKTATCKASAVSCRSFGLPKYDQTRLELNASSSQMFETVYLKNDVKKYQDALCSENELFCEAYTYNASGQSGTDYFRAPSDHACEYKEGIVVAKMGTNGAQPVAQGCNLPNATAYVGSTYDGWFRVGTDCPCYPELLHQGQAFGIRLTGDVGFNALSGDPAIRSLQNDSRSYRAWTGICPQTQAECTEFRDVNDKSDPIHPLGRPYFVINDERLDKESCGGKVDPGQGCVLFRDMSDTKLIANSLATFKEYALRGYRAVSPVDCTATPDLQSCKDARVEFIADLIKQADAVNGTKDQSTCIANYLRDFPTDDETMAYFQCLGTSKPKGLVLVNLYQPVMGGNPLPNDTNLVIKVKADRSCSQWLACKTGETVYDQSIGQYKSICSQLELCNKAGANEGEGVPFCESYVDRSQGSLSTILTKDRVFDAKTYATRPTGFGSVDYSGFTIADQFQVMDTLLEPVGTNLSSDPRVSALFKKDYRLAVNVPMSLGTNIVRQPQGTEAAVLAGQAMRAFACYFVQTGSYGLLTDKNGVMDPNHNLTLDSGESVNCTLSIDQSQPAQLGVSGAALVADNLNALTVAQRFAQTKQPGLDQTLSRSFPNTQCKAAPQPDSPYGNDFVTEWDASVSPPVPKRAALGYGNANFCEYGEDCSCVYKKATYGKATSKFYEPLSTDVVNAVCVGGPRNNLPCIPNSGIQGSQDIIVNVSTSGSSSNSGSQQGGENPNTRCGEGGVCTPLSGVSLVRGVTGQCLQYDISRPIAGDQSRSECLVWNPNPVLAGPSDQYHWDPTAGFQPPQSSGRYYCTSAVRQPRTQTFNAQATWPSDMPKEELDWSAAVDFVAGLGATSMFNPLASALSLSGMSYVQDMLNGSGKVGSCGDGLVCKGSFGPWPNSEGNYAGRMKAFFYADWFTSDGNCDYGGFLGWKNLIGSGCTGNVGGASIDGTAPASMASAKACEGIDQLQGTIKDENLLRLVSTGQGANRSYAEYAILFNPWQTAYGALGFPPSDWESAFNYSLEDVIANFEFTVPREKIECAYTTAWSSTGGETNEDHWRETDGAWHAAFTKYLAQGGGTLNRSSATILTEDGSPTGIPLKTTCAIQGSSEGGEANTVPDNRGDDNGLCYMKTWELDYRAQGQQKFQAFLPDIGRNGMDHLSRRPVYGQCDSSNPWFSIRAVFEDTNHGENVKDPTDINADQLVGPFQFVGLWVTACAPGNQTQFIYMNMKMNSADVCRELAETVSRDSHDSAAFTDRNWSRGGYSMNNGFSWNTTNMPFGASLATGDAGKQPLFMTGVKQSDVNPLNPPTFTSPGQTYFSSSAYPTSNWGLLSNVFAKIYRIYGYDSRSVTRDDWACTDPQSPNFGGWCPPLNTVASSTEAESLAQQYCGVQGKCVAGGIDARQMFSRKVCNAFSGVNRGLDCSSDPDICHTAPMLMSESGSLEPQYGSCVLFRDGYTDPGDSTRSIDAHWSTVSGSGAVRYRCQGANCPAADEGCGTDTGCSRAVAVKNGAFRCQNSVRDPGIVKETVTEGLSSHPTYASYCTKESADSSECPQQVTNGTCTGVSGSKPGTCAGHPWAQCFSNQDCSFEARNYFPSGSVNTSFYWTRTDKEAAGVGQHSTKLNQSTDSSQSHYLRRGEGFFYAFELGGMAGDDQNITWFTAVGNKNGGLGGLIGGSAATQIHADAFREAFWPAIPFGLDMGGGNYVNNCSEEGACFYATKIATTNTTQLLTYNGWDDTSLLRLYPGFNPNIWWGSWDEQNQMGAISANINWQPPVGNGSNNTVSVNSYYSGLSGAAPLVFQRVTSSYAADPTNPLQDSSPYIQVAPAGITRCAQWDIWSGRCLRWGEGSLDAYNSNKGNLWAQYGACESQAMMFQEPLSDGSTGNVAKAPIGTCRGGGRDGVSCSADSDCVAPIYKADLSTYIDRSKSWCNPVTSGANPDPTKSYRRPFDSAGKPVADACWPKDSAGNVIDDTADPKHPYRESDSQLDNNMCTHPAGYWPKPQYCLNPDDEYCGLFGYDLGNRNGSISDKQPLPTDVTPGLYTPKYLNSNGSNVSINAASYNYVNYYNPVPPHTAAPDVRTCQGQQCRVTQLDTFSIDGLAEGVVNGGVGSHVATIRFYGWAAHNQMPLRRVLIDWGDGTVAELPDAYLKNHKPYCGASKECSEMSGLTCQTDADCPPGGGQCVTMGNCSNQPNISCSSDAQCGSGGGFCEPRTPFGNDTDACEEQYFEFRHSYSCIGDALPTACNASSAGFCSHDPTRTCSSNANCAVGDSCIQNMSSVLSGCFDSTRQVCRFTPRIKLIDNWGWCTGECRTSLNEQSHKLEDTSSSLILHPNGGCFDAALIKDNISASKAIGPNECGETSDTVRPWIVFPGSVQLLFGQEL